MPGVKFIGLQEHCALLSATLAELWNHSPGAPGKSMDGEHLDYTMAADWLGMAADILEVKVLTSRFDESPLYCESVAKFEHARTKLLTRLATQLSIFSYAWGAFETVAKIVDPRPVPTELWTSGASGLVDRVIFDLKNYTATRSYLRALRVLGQVLSRRPAYPDLARMGDQPKHMGICGVGIDFVRRVRNRFAHGASIIPCGVGWSEGASAEPHAIALCTRIVLLTIQMLLSNHFAGRHLEMRFVLQDEAGAYVTADAHVVLDRLHTPRPVEWSPLLHSHI